MLVAVARRKDFATAARGKAIAVVMIERRQSASRAVLLRLSNDLELS